MITRRSLPAGVLPAALWAALIVAGHLLGQRLYDDDFREHIGAPPLVGTRDLHLSNGVLAAVLLAVGAVVWGPVLAAGLRWRALLVATWVGGAGWAVALAASDGWRAVSKPLTTRYEYLHAVGRVDGLHSFLSGFTGDLASYPTHVKGHPPGMLVLLWLLDRAGLGGASAAAVVVIAGGALTGPAALVALRALADEQTARRVAPFVAFTPAAVWVATSGDALFAGVTAVGIALFALAATAARRPAIRFGLAAGVVLGAALHLSYGIAPLGLLVIAIAAWRGAAVPLLAAAAGVALVVAAFAAEGFWWPDGLDATRTLYHAGVASRRPYLDFLVISPAAFALALGPAAAAGFARLRDRGAWVLAGGATAALAVADLSGLSRGETERIWLPFVPWLLVATASLGHRRAWLGGQLALGIALQVGVRTPW